MSVTWRTATAPADVPLLAAWNHRLIRDEGHRNPMTVPELARRMQGWLEAEYRAVIFSEAAEAVGYAVYRQEADAIHLRHFFIRSESRRRGLGRAGFALLRREVWPPGLRLSVNVLCRNAPGTAFWRSLGFHDYCLTLEIVPPNCNAVRRMEGWRSWPPNLRRNKPALMNPRAIIRLSSLVAGVLSAGVAAAQEPPSRDAAAKGLPGRVLHVSPQPLASIGRHLQFTTIGAAAKAVEPGDRVRIHAGVYRESVVVEKSGTRERPICFEAEPAARVIVTGADPLSSWRKEAGAGPDNLFSVEWTHAFVGNPDHAYPDDPYHLLIGRVEQVFVQDYLLRQVLRRAQLGRGSFWVDAEHQRLYAWSATNENLNDLRVEASVRAVLWQCAGNDVQLRGVRFRDAANTAQQAAAQFNGRGDVVEDCVFEDANGVGAGFYGAEQTVRRCTFQDNGQLGFSVVHAQDLLMSECLTRNNNTKNFARGWEAGGDKVVLSRGVTIEKSRFVGNRGSGLWFDIGNEACTVRNCLIADNEDAGIFYEISYGLHAQDNVIVGNGFAETPGAWGAEAGIVLSSSPGCVIERNLLVGNKEGFRLP